MGTSPSGGRDSNSPTSTSTEGKIDDHCGAPFVMHCLIQKNRLQTIAAKFIDNEEN